MLPRASFPRRAALGRQGPRSLVSFQRRALTGSLPLHSPSSDHGGLVLPVVTSTLRDHLSGRKLPVITVFLDGKITSGMMSVSRLRDETRVHVRDLLMVEQPLSGSQPRILPRRHCIPFFVGFSRGFIFSDRLILLNLPSGSSVSPIDYARSLAKHIRTVYGLDAANPSASAAHGHHSHHHQGHHHQPHHHPHQHPSRIDSAADTASEPGFSPIATTGVLAVPTFEGGGLATSTSTATVKVNVVGSRGSSENTEPAGASDEGNNGTSTSLQSTAVLDVEAGSSAAYSAAAAELGLADVSGGVEEPQALASSLEASDASGAVSADGGAVSNKNGLREGEVLVVDGDGHVPMKEAEVTGVQGDKQAAQSKEQEKSAGAGAAGAAAQPSHYNHHHQTHHHHHHSGTAAAPSPLTPPQVVLEPSTPFEFIVLEHLLLTMTARQHKRLQYAKKVLEASLSRIQTAERDDARLYSLFPLANTLSHYQTVSKGLSDAVRALLDDARDLREACLTEKAKRAGEIRMRAKRKADEMLDSYSPPVSGAPHGHHHHPNHHYGALPQQPYQHHEGADAFLGHQASPIASHVHLRQLLDNSSSGGSGSAGHHHLPSSSSSSLPGGGGGRMPRPPYPPLPPSALHPVVVYKFVPSGSVPATATAGGGVPADRRQPPPPSSVITATGEDYSKFYRHVSSLPPPVPIPPRPAFGSSDDDGGARFGSAAVPLDSHDHYHHHSASSSSSSSSSALSRINHHLYTHTHKAKVSRVSEFDLDDEPEKDSKRRSSHLNQQHQHQSVDRAPMLPLAGLAPQEDEEDRKERQLKESRVGGMTAATTVVGYASAPSSSLPPFDAYYPHHYHPAHYYASSSSSSYPSPSPSPSLNDPFPEILRISPDTLSQLELMLESVYFQAAAGAVTASELMRLLENKQNLLEISQSNLRNFLLSVSLKMAMLSVAVSSATFVSSLFGMNVAIPAGMGVSPYAFGGISVASAALGAVLFRAIDRMTLRHSPTHKHSRRLEALQSLLFRLDSKLDAAKETLSVAAAVSAGGAPTGKPKEQPSAPFSPSFPGLLPPSVTDGIPLPDLGGEGNVASSSRNTRLVERLMLGGDYGPQRPSAASPSTASPSSSSTAAAGSGGFFDNKGRFFFSGGGVKGALGNLFNKRDAAASSDRFTLTSTLGFGGKPPSSLTHVGGATGAAGQQQALPMPLPPVGAYHDLPGLGANSPFATNGWGAAPSIDRENGSVVLSKAAFKDLHLRTTGKAISDEEVDLLYELLDADQDGKLRMEEVVGLFRDGDSSGGGPAYGQLQQQEQPQPQPQAQQQDDDDGHNHQQQHQQHLHRDALAGIRHGRRGGGGGGHGGGSHGGNGGGGGGFLR